jgi:hypothetical protein
MIHVEFINDESGDLVDVKYYCSGFCYTQDTGKSSYGHAYPSGSETDYDVLCASCDALLWKGLVDGPGWEVP